MIATVSVFPRSQEKIPVGRKKSQPGDSWVIGQKMKSKARLREEEVRGFDDWPCLVYLFYEKRKIICERKRGIRKKRWK